MKRLATFGAVLAACAAISACVLAATSSFAASSRSSSADEELTARILLDCATNRWGWLSRPYSVRALRVAQRDIPRDVAEYTSCPDAIRMAISNATARVSVTIRRTRRGAAAAGRVTLLSPSGRMVDLLEVDRRQSAEFQVPPGTYVVRADGRRRCSLRVKADEWRTARARIVCPR